MVDLGQKRYAMRTFFIYITFDFSNVYESVTKLIVKNHYLRHSLKFKVLKKSHHDKTFNNILYFSFC